MVATNTTTDAAPAGQQNVVATNVTTDAAPVVQLNATMAAAVG